MASTESPSEETRTIRVAVLVREEMLHVADTRNPNRQEWAYDEDAVGAFTRHLEAIDPALLRVGTSPSPAHALLLLQRLLEISVPMVVVEGATEQPDLSEPADLLGAKSEAAPARRGDRTSELRALGRRIDQLRSMRVAEAERVAEADRSEIAESIEEHRAWLAERERDLQARLIDRMRACAWWRSVSSPEGSQGARG